MKTDRRTLWAKQNPEKRKQINAEAYKQRKEKLLLSDDRIKTLETELASVRRQLESGARLSDDSPKSTMLLSDDKSASVRRQSYRDMSPDELHYEVDDIIKHSNIRDLATHLIDNHARLLTLVFELAK